MKDNTLRGSRLGTTSLESDRGIEYSARKIVAYECAACGTTTSLTFAFEAESPDEWECSGCSAMARRTGAPASLPETMKNVKEAKTPLDMLLERRSRDELEEILNERLTYLRQRRGEGLEDLAG